MKIKQEEILFFCDTHPQNAAEALCSHCKKKYCAECGSISDGELLCNNCRKILINEQQKNSASELEVLKNENISQNSLISILKKKPIIAAIAYLVFFILICTLFIEKASDLKSDEIQNSSNKTTEKIVLKKFNRITECIKTAITIDKKHPSLSRPLFLFAENKTRHFIKNHPQISFIDMAYLDLILTLVYLENSDEALKILQSRDFKFGGDYAEFLKAEALFKKKAYAEALPLYKSIFEKNENNAPNIDVFLAYKTENIIQPFTIDTEDAALKLLDCAVLANEKELKDSIIENILNGRFPEKMKIAAKAKAGGI